MRFLRNWLKHLREHVSTASDHAIGLLHLPKNKLQCESRSMGEMTVTKTGFVPDWKWPTASAKKKMAARK
jgi:hypothetical protein